MRPNILKLRQPINDQEKMVYIIYNTRDKVREISRNINKNDENLLYIFGNVYKKSTALSYSILINIPMQKICVSQDDYY